MESYEKLDVIAVGAHPDDVEIACGGTLAKLAKQGFRVGMIDLTDGEPTPNSPGPEVRLAEAAEAAKALGIHKRILLDLPNRRLFDCFEARVALAKEFRKYRPDLVIGFGDKTPMASPDHWQAMLITDAAIFYSRLTKWDETFNNLPVHTIKKHLYFRLPFERQDIPGFDGNFIVDISDTIDQKIEAVRCYKTQFPPEKAYIFDRVKNGAGFIGSHAGYEAGESFVTAKAIGTNNLMNFLGLES